jgi:hypothetical protein
MDRPANENLADPRFQLLRGLELSIVCRSLDHHNADFFARMPATTTGCWEGGDCSGVAWDGRRRAGRAVSRHKQLGEDGETSSCVDGALIARFRATARELSPCGEGLHS